MLSGSNNNAEENPGRQEVRGKWGKSEQGRLHGGGDTGSWNFRKERRQERRQHPREDGDTSWGGGQGAPSHPWVSPGQRGWWRCLTSHNLGDLWSKGGNKQAYHGTERQDIERQSSLHSSGLLSRLIRVLRKQGWGRRKEV